MSIAFLKPRVGVLTPVEVTGTISGSVATQGIPAEFAWTRSPSGSVWAALRTGGSDETRVSAGTGSSGTVNLTPASTGTYSARLYDAASGGNLLDETEAFEVEASEADDPQMLTTFAMTNESGSEQAANWPSQVFGVVLPPGEMPNGYYPQVRLNDGTTVCPITYGGRVSHPLDGSWRSFMCFFRCPASVSGNASRTFQLWRVATPQTASGLVHSEMSGADLSMELVGVANLSGTWVASLNTGITDADDVVVYADGDAGKLLAIGQDFVQSGSPHGQLYSKTYLCMLKDAEGGFAGMRYNMRAQNGWADVASPTPTRLTVNAVLKSGGSTIRTLQGCDTTETVGDDIAMPFYTRFFSVGVDGKWDYAQSGGSLSADATMGMPVWSLEWLASSQVIPPFDPDVAASYSSNSSIDYYPFDNGPMTRAMGTAGERDDIGLVPTWHARAFFNQAAVDYRALRTLALMSGGWRTALLRQGTKAPVSVRSASYTGMGTPQPTWRHGFTGFQIPAVDTSLWNSETDADHSPNVTFIAYLLTGSPEIFDLGVEHGTQIVARRTAGNGVYAAPPVTGSFFVGGQGGRQAIINSVTYDGCVLMVESNLDRLYAWAFREILFAQSVMPDVTFTGMPSGLKPYLDDLVDANLEGYVAYQGTRSQAWQDGGRQYMRGNGGSGTIDPYNGTWTIAYLTNVLAWAVALRRTAAAVACATHLSKFWSGWYGRAGAAGCASFRTLGRDENGDTVEGLEDYAVQIAAGPTLAWVAATGVFTMGGGLVPTNGDLIGWDTGEVGGSAPGTWALRRKLFEVINVSGQTFKVAERGDTTPILPDSDGSTTAWLGQHVNPGTCIDYESGYAYLPSARMSARLLKAVGISGMDTAEAGLSAAVVTGGALSARYAVRASFG